MNNSAFIAGAMGIAFIIVVASRGELPTYLKFFGVGKG